MKAAKDLGKLLEDMDVRFTTHHHPAVFTVEEAKNHTDHLPGAHVKNLFLRDKKKTCLWLVTVMGDSKVDLRAMEQVLASKGRLSFGSPELLMEKLGVTPGSVTPLAAVNDTAGDVQVYIDQRIMDYEVVNVHPLVNTMTTALAPSCLVRFLEDIAHTPTLIDIPLRED